MTRNILAGLFVLAATTAQAGDAGKLRTELEPMAFLVGSCWQGDFPGGVETDIHCFDAVYDGVHIRDRHAVSGGAKLYRGETMYSWNGDADTISFVYWNSLGGVSTGSAKPNAGTFVFPNETYKGPEGETIIVSAFWENISADGYDQLSVETYPNGQKRERRVHYDRKPFTDDPATALE